ncbi:hypothetical protein BDV09DRAFT_100736 [Aspergillus tetrazonus]
MNWAQYIFYSHGFSTRDTSRYAAIARCKRARSSSAEHPLLATAGATTNRGLDLRPESYGRSINFIGMTMKFWRVRLMGQRLSQNCTSPRPLLDPSRDEGGQPNH